MRPTCLGPSRCASEHRWPRGNLGFKVSIMKVEPLGDKVLVRRLQAAEKTAGGIVLPGSAQDKPTEGRVLSVGPGRTTRSGQRVKSQVSDGDRVVFSSWSGTEITLDGTEVLILSEDDILAIIN
jgi:chaperonin GroES